MYSIRFPLIAALLAFSLFVLSIGGCSGSNTVDGRIPTITSLSGEAPAATPEPECPPGEIFFGMRCRQQRGIIIDQKPSALGIIIDQKTRPQPPPPPPPPAK